MSWFYSFRLCEIVKGVLNLLSLIEQKVESSSHFPFLKSIQNRQHMVVSISCNENPMYVDQEGNRQYDEPAYQLIIQVRNRQTKEIQVRLYDYFDVENKEELNQYLREIQQEIHLLGFSQVVCFH